MTCQDYESLVDRIRSSFLLWSCKRLTLVGRFQLIQPDIGQIALSLLPQIKRSSLVLKGRISQSYFIHTIGLSVEIKLDDNKKIKRK